MKDKYGSYSLIINFILAIVTTLGIIIAINANEKADKANELSEEANRIAQRALDFQQLSMTSDITVEITDNPLIFYGYICEVPYVSTRYVSKYKAYLGVTITNRGGSPISLKRVMAYDNNELYWNTEIFSDNDYSQQIMLPFDLEAGVSRSLYIFTYTSPVGPQSLEDLEKFGDLVNKLNWSFVFGDDSTELWSTGISKHSVYSNSRITCVE